MSKDSYPLQEGTINWHPQALGQDVPIELAYTHDALNPGVKPTLILPDYGGGPEYARSTLGVFHEHGVPAVAIVRPPIRNGKDSPIEPTQANIERGILEGSDEVIQQVFVERGQGLSKGLSLSGHSGGGGQGLLVANARGDIVDNVAVVSPPGITTQEMGNTQRRQQMVFWTCFLLNVFRREQFPNDAGNRTALKEIMPYLWQGLREHRLGSEVGYAFSKDGAKIVSDLVDAGKDVKIFGSERDVFKAIEYMHALGAAGVGHVFEEIPGSHPNTISKSGKAQMSYPAKWLAGRRAA